MERDTIFDKILAGDLPADKVYEDEHVLAFKDINPVAPIHILVIPKKRVDAFEHIGALDVDSIGIFFLSIAKIVKRSNLGKGYRVVINSGAHGQQSVGYLHAHIIGGRQMQWPPG